MSDSLPEGLDFGQEVLDLSLAVLVQVGGGAGGIPGTISTVVVVHGFWTGGRGNVHGVLGRGRRDLFDTVTGNIR